MELRYNACVIDGVVSQLYAMQPELFTNKHVAFSYKIMLSQMTFRSSLSEAIFISLLNVVIKRTSLN